MTTLRYQSLHIDIYMFAECSCGVISKIFHHINIILNIMLKINHKRVGSIHNI